MSRSAAAVGTALAVALAYFATGRLGLMLPALGTHVTLLWLPTGIAVAALYRWGRRGAIGVALGAVAVNLAVGTPWAATLGIAVGNTLGPVVAVWMLRRMSFHPGLDRSRDMLLLTVAAVAGMLVTSSLGVATLASAGTLAPAERAPAWLRWWAGDALGVVVGAPAVLTFSWAKLRAMMRRRLELVSWLVTTVAASWLVFVVNDAVGPAPALSVAFVPLPFIAWAALRFDAAATSLGLVIVVAIAASATANEDGPFARGAATDHAVVLWLFAATCAALGWLISALRASQRHGQHVQRLLDRALSDATLGVLLSGLDRKITYVSDGFSRLTGYAAADLMGRSCALLQGPGTDPDTVASLKAALHEHRGFDGEILNYRKDGTTFWNGLMISLVRDEHGAPTGFLGVLRDITARRAAEGERVLLDRKLQETQKLESLGVLAGGIAHDFNNLLTSILGNASLAMMEVPGGSPVRQSVEEIIDASRRAADLCRQMLAYSGRGRFVTELLDLGQVVQQTAQMLHLSISKKATLRFRLDAGLPAVEADATQIRQVVMNLVINASEAIGDQPGVITLSTGVITADRDALRATLTAPELPAGDYVVLEVADSGSGMSPATKAKIFDPFFTTKFTGRGLGLAAVLGIVRGHRGALDVQSELGQGTTFRLLFPAAAGHGATVAAPTPTPPAWRGTGAVLVVDDEESVRSTVARLLRHLGLEPVLAADGREAVDQFRATPARFTLVLLDLSMPVLDGEQTLAELRQIHADVRVVLMSGFDAQEATRRFGGKGLASFLQKPFELVALRAILETLIA